MMPLDLILPRLKGVRRNGEGYRADCPAGHRHARGSLALSQAEDGRVLLHCFACDGIAPVLDALGLNLADLYPERLAPATPEARRAAREAFKRSAWAAALGVLAREALLLHVAVRDLRAVGVFTGEDADRLALAESRIAQAREVLA